MAKPTTGEIRDELSAATDNEDELGGMTYQQGVIAALLWVIGDTDEHPMVDE